ncbi:DivIVA domain-containing protein [Ancrocorticia populi]|uniref:Cell wall synthesis protein Wag31 n=1 Tax=Ancrocorticia populi TaxID=2175228 RepID=A0A2V1K3M3_9ACTO|nr:DivIVA domain-containing protein [Ancrocorticia populi]PWF25824.1 cell division protein DivIVA [Ancrocorticia populi]
MALLTEHDVVNMRFKEPRSLEEGYDQDEVDFFLDEVAESIAQLTKDKAELENQLKVAQARATELEGGSGEAAPAPDSATSTASFPAQTHDAESATGLLAMAQELHDKHVSEGKAEGDRIISEANAQSEQILGDAQDQYNRTLTALEQERGLLERKISELRDFERDYRTRLKSYLESLLSNVEVGQNGADGLQG